jgi:hypothetical protein
MFKPKIPIWVDIRGSCNGLCWSNSCPFGILCGHLVYFASIWYILWTFWYIFPILVCCTKENLAILLCGSSNNQVCWTYFTVSVSGQRFRASQWLNDTTSHDWPRQVKARVPQGLFTLQSTPIPFCKQIGTFPTSVAMKSYGFTLGTTYKAERLVMCFFTKCVLLFENNAVDYRHNINAVIMYWRLAAALTNTHTY